MKTRFYVDNSDPPFPRIRVWQNGCEHEPQTLAQCKREIRETAVSHINHWREQLRVLAKQTAKEIITDS